MKTTSPNGLAVLEIRKHFLGLLYDPGEAVDALPHIRVSGDDIDLCDTGELAALENRRDRMISATSSLSASLAISSEMSPEFIRMDERNATTGV